jgi:hypothetical protein
MDTPSNREANVLSDDILERLGLPETQPDEEKITTADLAGAEYAAPASVKAEPLAAALLAPGTPRTAMSNGEVPTTGVKMAGPRGTATVPAMVQETGPLFSGSEANEFRAKWDAIQVGFVDEPRGAVELADNLVAGTMKRLAEVFAAERSQLEGQWEQGQNVSTEDLRLALRRYRSFFGRLLSV